MRLLHTSDWHLGRTFHGHPTTPALRTVLDALVAQVREHDVDVVLVSGDLFDHAAPAAELFRALSAVLREIRAAGAQVVAISGNHDSATRLGFQAEWAALAGVHVLTDPANMREPVTLHDEHGPVHLIGLPYLEPLLVREHFAQPAPRSHRELLGRLLPELDAERVERGGRHVILSHCFAVAEAAGDRAGDTGEDTALAQGSDTTQGPESAQEEHPAQGAAPDAALTVDPEEENAALARDLTQGGLDYVPAGLFSGFDYAALGHLHGRARLAENVRYSGAPLHLSFAEADKPRGSWLVDLGAPDPEHGALAAVTWLPLPVPRPLTRLTGTLEELLTEESHDTHRADWVQATLTDTVRPLDAMRRLRERFPFCAQLEYRPTGGTPAANRSYSERVSARSDRDVVAEFLGHVRNGSGPDEAERDLIEDVLAEVTATTQRKDQA